MDYVPVVTTDLEGDPIPVLRPLPNCPPLRYIEMAWFEFDAIEDFEFREALASHGIPPRRIGGKVSIIEGSPDQASQVKAVVAFGSSDSHMVKKVAIAQLASTLLMESTILEEEAFQFPNLCLTLNVFLFVKPHVGLGNLKINVTNLSVEIQEGLTMKLADQMSITAAAGSVACIGSSTFSSRETVIDVHSGTVSGNWALFDLLSIHTQSGSISVAVQPKEASKTSPLPAVFVASAQSGSVAIRFPTAGDIPERDYRVDVFAQSGSVSGSYIHGARTSLKSRSGSLSVDLLLLHGNANHSTLITESRSGLTSLNLLTPYFSSGSIHHLYSRHESHAGSLTLNYPQQWQGTLEGRVTSGSLEIHGDNINIIRDDGAGSGRHIVAEKGNGNNHMQVEATSGSAVISFT